ncbi:hypothetical protein CCAX7_37260 [Capsulimonas corticalis]|uniref:Uncharacterized protein n=1 Tax=Capsulimonas corticalis TaxID=2219043 RepID=A0A402D198_9BACT|nr:hypothetical protein [Capsulimonas corticalis]BDI31675.1 hypothetical protein CCAX7_37260 [Capsulimonas corticalis]
MNRNIIIAVCAVSALSLTCGAASGRGAKRKPVAAFYQHSEQTDDRTTVTDKVSLHPDGTYDQEKETDIVTKEEADLRNASSALTDTHRAPSSNYTPKSWVDRATEPHGNPPKDAGVEAWKNPQPYWDRYQCNGTTQSIPPLYATGSDTKRSQGTWRLLDKPGGASIPLPSSILDLPAGAVIEVHQAIPMGLVGKTWKAADLVLPAKEFNYYHSY